MKKNKILLVALFLIGVSCQSLAQKQSYFPRTEVNKLAPNPGIEKLLGFSFHEITSYRTVDEWAYMAENIFSRPASSAIVEAVKRKYPGKNHPRILLTKSSLSIIKERIKNDRLYQKWFADVVAEANQIILEPTAEKALRHVIQNRLLPLGLVYQVTGEEKYAERAWKEMEAYSNFEHWNPTTQFLDIAYITKGFAIGFDWFYDYLDEKQRQTIINAVSEKALKLAMVAYQNPTNRTPYQNNKITGFDNWNGSINAGLIMCSLALCDEQGMENLCGYVIQNGLQYWENYLKEFAPDGGCREGVGYWYWGVQSLVEGMAALESATGTDYGIGKTPGLASTAYFPVYMTGPKGAFNFGNAKDGFNITAEFFWFAQKYNDPKLAQIRKRFMDEHKKGAGVYDILWYDSSMFEKPNHPVDIPLDMWFVNTETFSFRSDWGTDALFVAVKGGENMATHGHLNTGSFVLDAMGERWALQLGSDSYSNPGYFTKGERNSQGYQYYRVRAEGQNTLLINPDSLSDQLPRAVSKIEKFYSGKDRVFSVIDMTEAYSHKAISVKRGAMLFDRRSKVILRDEIRCKKPSQVYWFMHTGADIKIINEGKTAILSQNGQSLRAELFCSDDNAVFSVKQAVPLPSSPQSNFNKKNEGIQKLSIIIANLKDVDISVMFVPITEERNRPQQLDIKPLDKWRAN